MYICSLRYPSLNAHAPFYHLWPSTFSHKRHDFRKKSYSTQNACFDFFTILSETFLLLRLNELYIYIIYLLTAIGSLPGGSGYFTCTQI